ncbi:hypothetical protein PROFUN_07520 [Planoprotostelium fungivorum]|uniref:E2 ubiquitin-conjugating enzyme n=1 Tax=Planoprotostelium fungivorum TaxID=1890364 RepID=A0A2P6NLM7_9EUKA|nr:hypothetical protein PROFUN_07520 [Planoprotostelium fungivorum]
MRRIMKEVTELVEGPPEGIRVILNEEDVSDIQSLIDGPAGTPYEGGQFRIKLKLSPDFPNSPPKGYFATKIFHPNVSAKGEICVNTLKKDWKPELGIKHVLLTIKCLLIVPNPESALNEEAGKLLLEKYDDYAKHAKLMTEIHAKKIVETAAVGGCGPVDTTKKPVAAAPASKEAVKKAVEKKKSIKRL